MFFPSAQRGVLLFFDMDKSSGGERGLEMMGLEAKVLSTAEVEQYASQIQALKYDALNPEENLHAGGTYGEHRATIKQEVSDMGKSGSRDSVIAVLDGDKVVGFMAVEKTSPTEAEVKELWTASSGRSQRSIVRKLLGKAKEHFSVGSVHHLNMDLESASQDVGYATSDSSLQHFVRPVEGEAAPEISKHTEGVDEVVE